MISDRFDRRRTVLKVVAAMTMMTASVAFLIHTGNMRPWMMFSYMLLSSVCSVLDTTNRPALIYDVLFASGAEHFVGTAMALRSVRALTAPIHNDPDAAAVQPSVCCCPYLLYRGLIIGTDGPGSVPV